MFVNSLLLFIAMLLLTACSGDAGTGPKEVKWDRDACERCRMVLSDHVHAAQIRYQPRDKKRPVVALFDDIGCATLWLEDKPWRDDPATEIWVTDHRTGEWIDARQATYVSGQNTPMEFGLGAQADPAPGGLTFEEAKLHINKVEERFNIHGVHLLERLKEQAVRREASAKAGQELPSIIRPDRE
jgi:nitrous oxide reductase accessory protein NosL